MSGVGAHRRLRALSAHSDGRASPGPGGRLSMPPDGRPASAPDGRRVRSVGFLLQTGAAVRRARPGTSADVEMAAVLDLLDAACATGVGVPRALDAVGAAIRGTRGVRLRRAADALLLGAGWDEAWAGSDLPRVAGALRPGWEDGVPPGALLRSAAEAARREREVRSAEAAGRLATRVVLPLGLCHLPAFVLVGVVPVLVSMAGGALG